jgi:Pectate lyase superfamily protein
MRFLRSLIVAAALCPLLAAADALPTVRLMDKRPLAPGDDPRNFDRATVLNAIIDHICGTGPASPHVNVKCPPYNAKGDGTTDDTAAVQAAITAAGANGRVFVPAGTYLITSKLTTVSGQHIQGSGKRLSTLRKGYNGYLLNLAQWGVIEDLGFDGQKATRTGGGIEITLGSNTSTLSDRGHQLIRRCWFQDFSGYAVDFTAANKGVGAQIEDSHFWQTDADAAIKWPDEPASMGNRTVTGCYSYGAIVNVGGADNGFIQNNITGGVAAADQGVKFPAGTTNRAKKLIIIGNRFAIANGTVNVRGTDHVVEGNVIAGGIVLESNAGSDGASNCRVTGNVSVTPLVENNYGAENVVWDPAIIKTRLFGVGQAGLYLYGSSGSFFDNPSGALSLRAGTGQALSVGDLTSTPFNFTNATGTWQFILNNGTAVIRLGSASGPLIRSGSGTPEGAVTAPVGSLYLRTDGGAGTSHYVKESGAGNTGWAAK